MSDEQLISLHLRMRKEAFEKVGKALIEKLQQQLAEVAPKSSN